ncbi:hypothetical protein GKE82_21075 [Conexibacter sp. W3-3-2]|uniref:PD40 domain-containing protein n=1 Tax=Conexibacter sp. W3-3-2 TaxID=2675227 RepID=UPI0012B74C8B|nr:PD40 domain-containing protein [Conexibacter sp. W3-3-2]MTD46714.1 hypothetical protein [Conexibacter sp. W3-3-2]
MRRAVLAALAALLLLAPTAVAQDSDAPAGALPHWLPTEQWVYQHWLPYDEARLYAVLGTTRARIWRHLRDDRAHTLGQLATRRGLTLDRAARALVAPRLRTASPALASRLLARARRTLDQGHLSQHLLFHSLHQLAIPDRATTIFGAPSKARYLALRRAELSPNEIGRLYGRTQASVQRAAARALRDAAAAGTRSGAFTSRQAAILLDRQLRQLPRFLGQRRYNGPPRTGPGSRPLLPPNDYANRPTITADGATVVFDAYRATIPQATALGEIHVQAAALADPASTPAELTPPARLPQSTYNSQVSADGSTVVAERAAGNLTFAKRYGHMRVIGIDRVTNTRFEISHRDGPSASRTAYNPSVSGDGRRVVFEMSQDGGPGGRSTNALLLFDRATGKTRRIAGGSGYGTVYEPSITADGRFVTLTAGDAGADGRALVYRRSLATGQTVLVSRADGPDGRAADGDAREPSASADGRLVAFASTAGNLGGGPRGASRIYLRDVVAGTTRLVAAVAGRVALDPALSADGRALVFTARERGDGRRSTVLHVDLPTGRTTVVSRGRTGGAGEPVLSGDGRVLAYTTTAGVLGKPAGVPGVVVRDLQTGTDRLLSSHAPISAGPGARPAAAAAARRAGRARATSAHYVCDLAG